MPTTPLEAKQITTIIDRYLPFEKAKQCTRELRDEVGAHTDNQSLKVTLEMLAILYEMPVFRTRNGACPTSVIYEEKPAS